MLQGEGVAHIDCHSDELCLTGCQLIGHFRIIDIGDERPPLRHALGQESQTSTSIRLRANCDLLPVESDEDRHQAFVKGQSFIPQAHWRKFADRQIDPRVREERPAAGGIGSRHAGQSPPSDRNACAPCQTDSLRAVVYEPGDRPRDRAGPLVPRHGDERNSSHVAGFEQRIHGRLGDRPLRPAERAAVQVNRRTGVDFEDPPALFFQRPPDVDRHHIDPGHVQPHRMDGVDHGGRHAGMHVVGHVDDLLGPTRRRIALQRNDTTRPGDRSETQFLLH